MKLKERIMVGLSAILVCLTLYLVIDLEIVDIKARKFLPSHGKINRVKGFQKRILQKSQNGSKEYSVSELPSETKDTNLNDVVFEMEDFSDLIDFAASVQSKSSKREKKKKGRTLGEALGIIMGKNASVWERFHAGITHLEMYPENGGAVPELLRYMSKDPLVYVTQREGGTQLKLIFEFAHGGESMFKPMRFSREQQTLPNHFYFTDFERHNSEIAAFHLDRVLGFRRAPPITGRLLNMTTELYALAEGDLLKTFFISPAHNLCFHGRCSYYCDTGHAICGNPDTLEGSFAAYLPHKDIAPRKTWRHPWRRSYHKRKKAHWEIDNDYCELVREVPPYNEGRRMLDLMDMALLDFLMGNMDRHHYETFKAFGNNSFPIHLDHGRGFGKPFHDEISILAPLYQCCLVRHSTLMTLLRFHHGNEKLSKVLKEAMKDDPLVPILWEPHLRALDRRVAILLQVIRDCINKNRYYNVIIYDS